MSLVQALIGSLRTYIFSDVTNRIDISLGSKVINHLLRLPIKYFIKRQVGEVSKVKLLCPDDKETYADVEIDLTKVNVQVDDAHTNNVVIDENRKLGIVFNYPTLEMTKAGFNVTDTDIDSLFEIMANSINHIYEGDKIYPSKDSTKEEMKKFLEGLPQTAFNKIKTFFETMPQLRHSVEVENPKTKVKSTIVLQGIRDFFQ